MGHAASPLPPPWHCGPRRALPLISGLPLASMDLAATPLSAVPRNVWALVGAPYEVTGPAGERKGGLRVVCFDCQSASVRSWIGRWGSRQVRGPVGFQGQQGPLLTRDVGPSRRFAPDRLGSGETNAGVIMGRAVEGTSFLGNYSAHRSVVAAACWKGERRVAVLTIRAKWSVVGHELG